MEMIRSLIDYVGFIELKFIRGGFMALYCTRRHRLPLFKKWKLINIWNLPIVPKYLRSVLYANIGDLGL